MTDRQFIVVGTAAETTISVRRESWSGDVPQGLVLDADHPMQLGDVVAERIVLWSDRAPDGVDILTGEAGELRMWNVWRDGDLVQAWENGAGMVIDDQGDDLGLSCHDGHDTPGPELVVRIAFDRVWSQPTDED